MGYIEKNLIAGEEVIFKTGRHWIVLLTPGLFGGSLILIGILLITGGFNAEGGGATGVALFIAGFGTLIFTLAVISRNATEMAVTKRRVIVKVGLLRIRTIELFLSKVESIDVAQGLLGRLLGYGSIVVRGTGGTAEPFTNIRSPLVFRRQVQQQSETRR